MNMKISWIKSFKICKFKDGKMKIIFQTWFIEEILSKCIQENFGVWRFDQTAVGISQSRRIQKYSLNNDTLF